MTTIKPKSTYAHRIIMKTTLILDTFTGKKYVEYRSARTTSYEKTDLDIVHDATVYDLNIYGYNHINYLKEEDKLIFWIKSRKYNEYDIRNMVLREIKRKKDNIRMSNKDNLVEVCKIFDQCDKILARSDTRKNPNTHEAATSYEFLMSKYEIILEMSKKGGKL